MTDVRVHDIDCGQIHVHVTGPWIKQGDGIRVTCCTEACWCQTPEPFLSIPDGFTTEEWVGWQSYSQNAREVAKAIDCNYATALLILGLNEIATQLGEITEMLGRRRGPDEPWKPGDDA